MDVQTVLDDLASRSCNSITATYYLLQQRYRTTRVGRGGGSGSGGGETLGQTHDQKSKHLPCVSKEHEKDRHSEKNASRNRVERIEFHGAGDEEQTGEEMKEEAKEREKEKEETIIITLPKNYQAINGAGVTSKAAMSMAAGVSRTRKENNGTLSVSVKDSNASGGTGTAVNGDKIVADCMVNSNTNMSTRATTTQSSFNAGQGNSNSNNNNISNSVGVNGTAHIQSKPKQVKAPSTMINIIPSYLSLRAKEVKAALIDTPSSSSSSSSSSSAHVVEHVVRRPDLQPPSFAVRRGRPSATATTAANVKPGMSIFLSVRVSDVIRKV